MQDSPGGMQLSVAAERDAGETLALVAEFREPPDELGADFRALAAGNLDLIDVQAAEGHLESALVTGGAADRPRRETVGAAT